MKMRVCDCSALGGRSVKPTDIEQQPLVHPRGPEPDLKTNGCHALKVAIGVAILFLVMYVVSSSPPMPSPATEVGKKPPSTPTFFRADQTNTVMPLAPAAYPDALKGMIWLDTFGYYGTTDIPSGGFQDAVVSWGDLTWPLNTETKTMYYSTSGPGWMWLNNAKAYQEYNNVARGGSYYFQWNQDYTEARLWETTYMYGHNIYAPQIFHQYWMSKQPAPPPGACPPPPDATKEQRNQCATWVRTTCIFFCIGSRLGFNKPLHYYVYQVVDANGQKVQPYFDAMVSFAQSKWAPDATAAAENNIPLDATGLQPGTVLHGVYQ